MTHPYKSQRKDGLGRAAKRGQRAKELKEQATKEMRRIAQTVYRDLKRKLAALDHQKIIPERSLTQSYAPTMAMIQKAIQQERGTQTKSILFTNPIRCASPKARPINSLNLGITWAS